MKKTLKWSLMMMLAVVGLTFASCSDDDDTPTVETVEDVNGEFTGKMTYAKEAKEAKKPTRGRPSIKLFYSNWYASEVLLRKLGIT